MDAVIDLRELTPGEIAGELATLGATPEQVARICRAVLRDGIVSVDSIPVARRLRERLAGRFAIRPPVLLDRLVSSDGRRNTFFVLGMKASRKP